MKLNSSNQEIWYDIDRNKHFLLNNGKILECDTTGKETKFFVPYVTGFHNYKKRAMLSERTGKTHILPEKPECLLNNSELYCPAPSKIDGYAQFPRPSLNRSVENLREHIDDKRKSMEACQRSTCTFFSQKGTFMKKNLYTSRIDDSPCIQTNKSMNNINKSYTELGFPMRKTLYGSGLKSRYLPFLKETFKPISNISKLGENTRNLLMRKEDNGEEPLSLSRELLRSYNDIKAHIKKEQEGFIGFIAPTNKEKPLGSKGIFNIKVPTQGELAVKAKEFRKNVNPFAYNEERKREELDLKLFKKRKEQKRLKLLAMQSILRKKEKELLKEIKEKSLIKYNK